MWLRLRQICFVAEELAPVEEALMDIFRVKVSHREPNIKRFGLENVLFPFGNQFVEVVAPIDANTTAGRYLERRGGEGGYMFITQCDKLAPRRARVESLGIRIVEEMEKSNFLISSCIRRTRAAPSSRSMSSLARMPRPWTALGIREDRTGNRLSRLSG